jgi:hypothetical protein
MSSVNAGDHKQRFDKMQPDGATQADFIKELLDAYEIVEDSSLDVDEVVDRIETTIASRAELAAYRGCRDALEEHQS